MNRIHLIIYRNSKGIIVEMPIMEFLQIEPQLFLHINISANSNALSRHLVFNHGFTLIANDEKVICFNLL